MVTRWAAATGNRGACEKESVLESADGEPVDADIGGHNLKTSVEGRFRTVNQNIRAIGIVVGLCRAVNGDIASVDEGEVG